MSVFYGLAKAAGDSTQSASSNVVGIYTDNAKGAIQNMLGISNLISNTEVSTATATHAVNSLFLMDGALYRATTAIAIGDAVTAGTNCEAIKIEDVFVKNTDIATKSKLGIIKAATGDYGVKIESSGELRIYSAFGSDMKGGSIDRRPLTPKVQHEAVFYGLAAAAGDTTQASSANAVGVYTDNAKTAIQGMLAVAPINNARFTGTFSINDNTTTPLGVNSISIGGGSTAPGNGAIALGITAEAQAGASVAIGLNAKTKGVYSTAIGEYAQAQYQASIVMGTYNALDNITDWAENTVYAENDLVYVNDYVYECTTAHTSTSTFDSSKWSMVLNKLFVIGNGNSSSRSNAMTVDISGNTRIKGNLYIGANADGSGGTILAPIEVIRL